MEPAESASHARENRGLLAGAERRLLIWIAERMPLCVHSDHLSALSLVAMAAAGLSFAALPLTRFAAVGVVASLVVNWFGDSLDGTVARVRNCQRPRYGYYVDHVIDLAGAAILLAGMARSGLMSPLVALVILAGYFMVAAESYLATHARGVFRLSFLGFGPTELRIVLIAGVLAVLRSPYALVGLGVHVRLFDLGGAIAAAGLPIAFVVSAIRNGAALYRAEPRPRAGRPSRAA